MTHYPAEPAEENFRGSRGSEGAAGQAARAAKTRARRWVRRLGMAAACLQLGTAFAATRALFTRESRQRLVDMDLRCAHTLNSCSAQNACPTGHCCVGAHLSYFWLDISMPDVFMSGHPKLTHLQNGHGCWCTRADG